MTSKLTGSTSNTAEPWIRAGVPGARGNGSGGALHRTPKDTDLTMYPNFREFREHWQEGKPL